MLLIARVALQPWRALRDYRVPPECISFFKFSMGAFLLFYFLKAGPRWIFFYGAYGSGEGPVLDWSQFTWRYPFVLSYLGRSEPLLWLYFLICIGAALSLLSGRLQRLSLIWLWYSILSMCRRNSCNTSGEEQILNIVLFLSLFLPATPAFRPWALVFRPETVPPTLPGTRVRAWAFLLIKIQMASIYFVSIFPKLLSDISWRDGTVVYYALFTLNLARFPGLSIMAWANGLFSRILGFYTVFIEIAFPLLVWFPRYRTACLLGMAALHLGLAFFLEGLVMFNLASLASLMCFAPAPWIVRQLRGLSTKRFALTKVFHSRLP